MSDKHNAQLDAADYLDMLEEAVKQAKTPEAQAKARAALDDFRSRYVMNNLIGFDPMWGVRPL